MIDIFLENQIILITLGLAVLPLIAAVLLLAIPRVRARVAKMKEARKQARSEKHQLNAAQKKAKARAKKRKASSAAPMPTDDEYEDEQYEAETAAVSSKRQSTSEARPEEAAELEDDESEYEDDELTEEGEVSGEMQSLLSNVFVDEEANARMEVLLSNTVEIEATDLLELCNQVADKLGTKSPAAR
jgi:hypothetical protein